MDNPLGQHLREMRGPVLLTGHTGFKGAWMTFLLEHLNVPVVGYSLLPDKDSLFARAERSGAIPEIFADIREYETLEKFIDEKKPSIIIHMAAQPLVLKSYENPRETFDVNVLGTVNVLDISFKKDFVKAIIVVTTDKVYRNDNSGLAFVETNPLEGKDPYSSSKVGTEAVVAAWQQIAKVSGGPRVISVRAGNVIGGGDFAENRIIPDLVRGVMTGKPVGIRNPKSIRPWQHVLDPLVGYLNCAEKMEEDQTIQSLNLGPNASSISVEDIIKIGTLTFPNLASLSVLNNIQENDIEAQQLKLDSRFANSILGWNPVWNSEEAIHKTFIWWEKLLNDGINPEYLCKLDIESYFQI
jgi:CDP-glucose 4,6-dehydratase